jgi:hypothetical protein
MPGKFTAHVVGAAKKTAISNHTWSTWKIHWTAAFAEMHNINRMTAGKATFGTNAAEEEHQAC